MKKMNQQISLACTLSSCAVGTKALLALGAVLVISSSTLAQSGRYFVTDESGFNRVWQFRNGALTNTFPTVPAGGADGPIIVDGFAGRVRSVKGGFGGGSGPSPGSEYDFSGNVTSAVSLDFSGFSGYGRVIDAAFDGTNSYIVSGLFGTAGVFQYNGDFSGAGALVFNLPAGPASTAQGITYDTITQTIWTSDYDFNAMVTGGRVRQWDPATGTELFSFAVVDSAGNASERNTALAHDRSDDTFWMNAHVEDTLGLGYGFGELWQFDRAGNFLQKIHAKQSVPGSPSAILYWGGEILTVPEPSSLLLLAVGSILIAAVRRRELR